MLSAAEFHALQDVSSEAFRSSLSSLSASRSLFPILSPEDYLELPHALLDRMDMFDLSRRVSSMPSMESLNRLRSLEVGSSTQHNQCEGPTLGSVLRSVGAFSRNSSGSVLLRTPLKEEQKSSEEKMDISESSTEHQNRSSPTTTASSSDDSSSPPIRSIIQRTGETGKKKKKELVKDDAYWQRRRKNNDAAKRSRDVRRIREDEIAQKAASLERENVRLKLEVEQLRAESVHLRSFLGSPSMGGPSLGGPPSLSEPLRASFPLLTEESLRMLAAATNQHGAPVCSSLSPPSSSLSSSSEESSPFVSSSTSPSPFNPSLPLRPIALHPHSVIARTSVLVGPGC